MIRRGLLCCQRTGQGEIVYDGEVAESSLILGKEFKVGDEIVVYLTFGVNVTTSPAQNGVIFQLAVGDKTFSIRTNIMNIISVYIGEESIGISSKNIAKGSVMKCVFQIKQNTKSVISRFSYYINNDLKYKNYLFAISQMSLGAMKGSNKYFSNVRITK